MNFEEVVKFAILQRPKFKEAIEFSSQGDGDSFPLQFSFMYSSVAGTRQSIEDQSLMDIVPGLRLIHRDEIKEEIARFKLFYSELENHIPFLADDSSCYVSLNTDDGGVYRVAKEYGTSKVANSIEEYWNTIFTCYNEGAFYLDSEGYLDFDFEKEGEIGKRINPECEYWSE